jgi:protein-disulfide isomerase
MKKSALIAIVAAGIVIAGGVVAFAFASPARPQKELSADELLAKLTTPTIPSAGALGSPDAKITIVEFGDYLCTYCHRFHQDTKDQVMANYVDTGKARFLFKDFPINDHLGGGSSLGAQASYCAADQSRYWEFHDGMYNNWGGEKAGWVTKESMLTYARNAGVQDMGQFKSCLDSGKYTQTVKDNYNFAVSIGLNATPSFIIIPAEGKPQLLSGAYPYSAFKQILDQSG